ncbi:MAG: hypothetical protein ACM3L5_00425 [Candidatus Saccharibacteria bacterium]
MTKRPWSVNLFIALELFYALLGIVSGILLIADPSGAGLGIGPDIRERIPFQSFLPVGLFLFAIYGIGSMIVAYGAITRKEGVLRPISERFGHHWAWIGGLAQTGILVVWLVVEGLLIGLDYPATYFTIVIGVAIFLTLLPRSTRRYFALSA